MVVGCADKKINIYNLAEPTKVFRVGASDLSCFLPCLLIEYPLRGQSLESSLKFQTRVIACFPAADGFAIGSVEGRVSIVYLDEKPSG